MTREDVDPEKTESLARDRLVEALRHPGESTRSDAAQLAELTASIKGALRRGETPEKRDIEEARFYTEQVEEWLDEVTALFSWNPWDTGARWGELTDEQQAEIEEHDRQHEVGHVELDDGETQLVRLTFDLWQLTVSVDFHIDQAEDFDTKNMEIGTLLNVSFKS
ncbi:hypothetical protein [Natrinema gari]|uniref:Uncharacterized protein n=1 Tax=Natrinema gari JCM 14663 TaxID=1230459 RepID=L9ZE44_9EURY|nr:hypothetical protein [Natrinema gari]ELY83433.1 hypothetical protein C486_02188 [Natrinema gari JCM 14663]